MSAEANSPKRRIRGKRRLKEKTQRAIVCPTQASAAVGSCAPQTTHRSIAPPKGDATVLEWAVYYITAHQWALVPIVPGEKRPLGRGWNRPRSTENPEGYITTVEEAVETWGRNPEYGIGVVLWPSRICSIDIDNLDLARKTFERVGIDIDELLKSGVRIQGGEGRAKLLYKVPDGFDLTTRKFSMPDPENPDAKSIMVFELRTGLLQDVLPPSIHPGTGKPYEWLSPPWRKGGIDELS